MRFIDYELTGKVADRINVLELTQAGLHSRDDGVRDNSYSGSAIWCRFQDHALQRRSDHWSAAGDGLTVAEARRLIELAPAGSILVDNDNYLRPENQWGEVNDKGERRVYFFRIFDSEGLAIFRAFLQEIAEKKEVPATE